MNKTIATITLALAAAPFAMAQAQQKAAPVKQPMGFFITSEGSGKGANLGGLAGADAQCQKLAAAAGAGNRTWRAYLSVNAADGQAAVNARDRIGQGPWFNATSQRVAQNLADLHGDTVELARMGNFINRLTALTEKGEKVSASGETPNKHDILTGSTAEGKAFTDGADHTCKNWTSEGEGSAQVGHHDRTGGGNISWNTTHPSRGCSQANLVATGGAGLFYCFAQ